ncbi:MAG: extracellular solute-binding protein [Defluviitaleaceae bacterium]|nr:extracellular solute-binding protein [Defluviitaleaceae bacterium]
MKKFFVTMCMLLTMLVLAACSRGNGDPINITQHDPPPNQNATNQDDTIASYQQNITQPLVSEPLSGNLTISAFDSALMGPFLEQAAELFTYRHPGVSITVDVFSAVPEVMEIELEDGTMGHVMTMTGGPHESRDYINQINTELMSGRGPDILSLDILPFHRYAQVGQLANLREFMDNDQSFNINDYRPNILDAISTNNELYMFPITIDFRYLAFDSSLLTNQQDTLTARHAFTFEELFDIARPFLGHTRAGGYDHRMIAMQEMQLFTSMLDLYQSYFIDIGNRRANFTDGVFVEMLNQIQDYIAAGYLQERWEENMSMIGGTAATQRYFYRLNSALMLFNEFNRDDENRMSMDFGVGITDDDLVAGLLGNSLGHVPFSLGGRHGGAAFGINANSPNQELAWEFIKFLSSDALIEILRPPGGIPLYVSALEHMAQMWATGQFFTGANERSELALTAVEQARVDAYMETVNRFMDMFNTFNVTDTIIRDMVLEAVRDYWAGDISAHDLANRLQSSVHLVLNE